jgi:hypothetical protein
MFILIAMAVISATVAYQAREWFEAVPPVKYIEARGPTEAVEAGSVVVLEYKQTRNRSCPADIYGWWIRRDIDAADQRLPMVHGGYSRVSEVPYWQPVVLNAPVYAGDYEYRANLIHFCDNGTFVTVTPPVLVSVK